MNLTKLFSMARRCVAGGLVALQVAVPTGATWLATSASVAGVAALVAPRPAYAGTGGIVFDPTNFAEAVRQTAEWGVQHANTLRSYITQLSQLKAAIDQILALKDMAIKDLLAGLGIGDLVDSISTVQSALRDVQNLGSDIQSLRTSFADLGSFWSTGTFNFSQFARQQMQSALRGGSFATSEFNRRSQLLEQTMRNLRGVQRSQSMIGSKSQQSSLDNLNAQTQMVATGIHTLLAEVVQENLYQTAKRKQEADSQVTSRTYGDWMDNLANWRASRIGSLLQK